MFSSKIKESEGKNLGGEGKCEKLAEKREKARENERESDGERGENRDRFGFFGLGFLRVISVLQIPTDFSLDILLQLTDRGHVLNYGPKNGHITTRPKIMLI
ncbi:hypothetical protein TorRG33x02_355290 [Trema orientale]|uniref:Uncharacterized protein n=1 Tax=Trema orientale TaxID=63057 RepID=A0A2P5A9K7_TREOI|nr:hypothetical protein TorRG33x02_355290 [Trema orientale]